MLVQSPHVVAQFTFTELFFQPTMDDIKHTWDADGIPTFYPTMKQFVNFKDFITAIDSIGSKAGLAKIIPPNEWISSQPNMTPYLKGQVIENSITQTIESRGNGMYTTTNFESRKVYSVQEWFDYSLTDSMKPPTFDLYGKIVRDRKRKFSEDEEKSVKLNVKVAEENDVNNALHKAKNSRKPQKKTVNKEFSTKITASSRSNLSPCSNIELFDSIIRTSGLRSNLSFGTPLEVIEPKPKPNRKKPDFNLSFDPYSINARYSAEYIECLEKAYWKNTIFQSPAYGADILGSLFEKSKSGGYMIF